MPAKPSTLIDTGAIYCGDNLEQPRKLPETRSHAELKYLHEEFAQPAKPSLFNMSGGNVSE